MNTSTSQSACYNGGMLPQVPSESRPKHWRILLGVLLFTLLVRGGAVWAMRERLNDDPDAYRQIAQGLLATGVFTRDVELDTTQIPGVVAPTAYRPPLYPILLTKLAWGGRVEPLAIGALHVFLGLCTVALVYRLGLDGNLGYWSALAALLVACDPILINQSALVMTETLATLLAVMCLWQLTRWSRAPGISNALGAGLLLGLAALCRPTFLPWVGLVGIGMFAHSAPTWRARVLAPLALTCGVMAMLAPWVTRNMMAFQRPIVTTTHGGYTLYLANNRVFYDYLRSGNQSVAWTPESDELFDIRGLLRSRYFGLRSRNRELIQDRSFQDAAKETIADQPGMFLYSCLVRVYYLWSPLPQKVTADESLKRSLARYLTATWYVGVYLLALAGLWKLRWQALQAPWIWGLTLCLAFTLMHSVYWSNLRMRAPLMPVVALLAACGASYLLARRAAKSAHQSA